MRMTTKQTVEKYPFFTRQSLKWQLFNRETNGLSAAVVKVGKRLLIDEEKFNAWIESHGQR